MLWSWDQLPKTIFSTPLKVTATTSEIWGTFFNMDQNGKNSEQQVYQLTINPRKVSTKPTVEQAKYVSRQLTSVTGLTINDFSKYIAPPYSYTWTGGIFDGTRANSTWREQSIFALDFDNTISIDDVLTRCESCNLNPQLWYKTFSAREVPRNFRIVFFISEPISEKKMHQFIMDTLLKIFPEADRQCKDASRYFFGGIESFTLSMEPISTSQFIDSLSINIMSIDSNSLRKIPLGLDYYSSLKSAGKGEVLYNTYRSSHISAESEQEQKKILRFQGGHAHKIDFDIARQKIRILDEFLSGKWLTHLELFGLATNLIHIKGGMKLMKGTMVRYNELGLTHYTQNNFNILPYVNNLDYFPQPIYKFSPYPEDSELLDIVSAIKDIRGFIRVLQPIDKIKIDQAEETLKTKFNEAVASDQMDKIYLFKLPTAIGKTEMLVNSKATIALPTNAFKKEIGNRMRVEYRSTPDSIVFEETYLNQKIEYYYRIGLPKKAMEVLYHMVIPSNASKFSESDIQTARKYLDDLTQATNSEHTVLTTHKRALFTNFTHNTVIFDEDPLNSLLEIKEMKISDLFKLSLAGNIPGINHLLEYLKSSTPSEIKQTSTFALNLDELIERISSLNVDSNLIDFLGSSYFVRDEYNSDLIYYLVRREFPRDKKIIIMSATIPIAIYQRLYGERVEVIDISDVEQLGSITQYTNRSCSRHGLGKYVNKISKKVGDVPVITFKSFGNYFENPVEDMYFGNCSGYDSLKGKDIAIVGTPHRNNVEYFLTAKILGFDFKTTDTTMLYQNIEYNGFRFKFNCFENNELRDIQLSLIESDLVQAVGRARTLRTKAKVDLYSNFPLRISDEFRF